MGFQAVALGVDHEGREIVRSVVGAQAWGTVVMAFWRRAAAWKSVTAARLDAAKQK
jgi:hypothetical protein